MSLSRASDRQGKHRKGTGNKMTVNLRVLFHFHKALKALYFAFSLAVFFTLSTNDSRNSVNKTCLLSPAPGGKAAYTAKSQPAVKTNILLFKKN